MELSNSERCAGRGLIAGASLMLLAACSNEKPVPRTASASNSFNWPQAAPPPTARQASVHVSEEFRKACKLPDGPEEAPRFDFGQASLRARGRNILDDIAVCLTGGPLKGHSIAIVGRADPRGSALYNQELGTDRAEAARDYLTRHGVPSSNMNVMSRGKLDAVGNDEASWELDRRVDLELGNRIVAASDVSSVKTVGSAVGN